jgi:hypothetical protein
MSIRGRCAGSGARRGSCFAGSLATAGVRAEAREPERFEVGFDRLLEQVALLAVQLLAAGGELPAPHHRHLVRQLVDLQLSPVQLPILASDLLDQPGSEDTQLLRIHRCQLIVRLHGRDGAITCASFATKNFFTARGSLRPRQHAATAARSPVHPVARA